MRKIIKYGFLIISIAIALVLILTKFIPNINPFEQSSIGVLAYLTPIVVILNLFFIIFWILTRKYSFTLIPIATLIFTWPIWNVLISAHLFSKQDFSKQKFSISVMSYNIRLLDLYNWTGQKETRKKIISFLKEQNVDILCLQEFYTGNDSVGFDNITAIQQACDYPYATMCDVNVNKRGRWGSVIFSKKPFIKKMNHAIDVVGSNKLQQADILLGNDTVSIFNIHLKSNKFSSKESELVGKKEIPQWNDTTISQTKNMYKKILMNTTSRGLEAQLVSNVIRKNHKKTIITCDLNDIASSYVYFKIKHDYQDVFLQKGWGLGATYVSSIPVLRIDYVFYSDYFSVLGYEKVPVKFTDHYPLKVNFSYGL